MELTAADTITVDLQLTVGNTAETIQVQVGAQQRSGAHFQRIVRYIQEGRIGEICYATVWTHFPMSRPRPQVTGGPPPGMDWEMWLGPAPRLPYDEVWNYGRNGYWDFWGGNTTEWGTHLIDIVLWAMKAQGPQSTVVTDGEIENARITNPGEVRGPSIKNGARSKVITGDVIIIPPGTTHQILVAPGKRVSFMVAKFAK